MTATESSCEMKVIYDSTRRQYITEYSEGRFFIPVFRTRSAAVHYMKKNNIEAKTCRIRTKILTV